MTWARLLRTHGKGADGDPSDTIKSLAAWAVGMPWV